MVVFGLMFPLSLLLSVPAVVMSRKVGHLEYGRKGVEGGGGGRSGRGREGERSGRVGGKSIGREG